MSFRLHPLTARRELELEYAPGGIADDIAVCKDNFGFMEFAAFRLSAGGPDLHPARDTAMPY